MNKSYISFHYYYLYRSMVALVDNLSRHHEDANAIYFDICANIKSLKKIDDKKKLCEKNNNNDSNNSNDSNDSNDSCDNHNCHKCHDSHMLVYMGAFYMAAVPLIRQIAVTDNRESIDFEELSVMIKHIINEIVDEDIRSRVLMEFLLALTYRKYERRIDLEKEKAADVVVRLFTDIKLDDIKDEDIECLKKIFFSWLEFTTEKDRRMTIWDNISQVICCHNSIEAFNRLYMINWD